MRSKSLTPFRRALLWLVAPLFALPVAASALALPQAQTDIVTPTGWVAYTDVPFQTVVDQVNLGFRVVDLEIEDDSPLRVTASLVRNTGDYGKAWWYYVGLTFQEVLQRMDQNQARLIDLEPFDTPSGLRYAAVMIRNAGADFAADHGFTTSLTDTTLGNWLAANPTKRIIDVDTYLFAGTFRYSIVWVENTGTQASPYWLLTRVNIQTLTQFIQNNSARPIDIEREDDNDLFTCLLVPDDGNRWRQYSGLSGGQVAELAAQEASRPIDLYSYQDGGNKRFGMVIRRNANDLTMDTTEFIRSPLNINVESGFLLREIGGSTNGLAGVFADREFEPAGVMAMVHNLAAHRTVETGAQNWNSIVGEETGTTFGCPNGQNLTFRTFDQIVRRMMEEGRSTAAKAVEDRLGTVLIEAIASFNGAPSVDLNRLIGCYCGSPTNAVTLEDLANLQDTIALGFLGDERDGYYERMDNDLEFGNAVASTAGLIHAEVSNSGLTPNERALFLSQVQVAQVADIGRCEPSGSIRHGARGVHLQLPERISCEVEPRTYFLGAWVTGSVSASAVDFALSRGLFVLFRDRVRAAIATWENPPCGAFDVYCTATNNSTGQPGEIGAFGTSELSRNDLLIRGTQMPSGSFASILFGTDRNFVMNPGTSAGNLCVGGSIGRSFDSLGAVGTGGTILFFVDNTDLSFSATGPFTLLPGDLLNFQWWYRDSSPTGPTSNFTNAVEVVFF